MAWRGRGGEDRREPHFGDSGKDRRGAGKRELRADPRDRAMHLDEPRRKQSSRRDDRDPPPPRHSRKGRKGGGLSIGRLFYWLVVMGIWAVLGLGGYIGWKAAHLPAIQSLEVPKRPPDIRIVGMDGSLLANRGDMGGAAVPYSQLPKYLPQAFVAIEDRRFFSHFGIDPIGIARAVVVNLTGRGVREGGSTLTQQLAKNLFLTQERSLDRKIQEALLALWLEHKFSKEQILELYMNRVYFGSGAWGVEAAAQRYFGKSARNVTLSEAAMIAGLVKAPSRLAPNRNPKGAQDRASVVLGVMADTGAVTADMAKVALSHPAVAVKPAGAGGAGYIADWVMDTLDNLVGGIEEDMVVETTIDPALQAIAEKVVVGELEKKGSKFAVTQGSLVAMDPNGAVRAMVGGRNYADSQYNRAVVAKRQPGSAFKPFVYLAALERGLTIDTMRDDAPINIKGWKPENYSREYFGQVTLRQALAMSLNTVAVRVGMEVGPRNVAELAHRLGISSKLEANASLALGTSEVSLLELVSAYVPFANGGVAVTPHVVAKVRTAKGKTLYRRDMPSIGRVIDSRLIGPMNEMMHETLVTGTARKAELPGWTAAGKTGTTQDFKDAWFVGYTGRLVTGVWLGNDDASPTKKATGGGLPVEVWSAFMKPAHEGQVVVDLPGMPGGVGAGGSLPSIFGGGESPPQQPAPNQPTRAAPPAGNGMTVDRWLMEKLFGGGRR